MSPSDLDSSALIPTNPLDPDQVVNTIPETPDEEDISPAGKANLVKKWTAQEERLWARLGNTMSQFHESFKYEFNTIYDLADGSFNKRGMSLRRYLDDAQGLNSRKSSSPIYLTAHHTIEERYVFPILAKKMPSFAKNAKSGHMHVKSHQGIHEGLDKLTDLIAKYRKDPTSYSPTEMRACLDSFRDVLFRHLDEEVEDLSAINMKKAGFTLQEVERIGH